MDNLAGSLLKAVLLYLLSEWQYTVWLTWFTTTEKALEQLSSIILLVLCLPFVCLLWHTKGRQPFDQPLVDQREVWQHTYKLWTWKSIYNILTPHCHRWEIQGSVQYLHSFTSQQSGSLSFKIEMLDIPKLMGVGCGSKNGPWNIRQIKVISIKLIDWCLLVTFICNIWILANVPCSFIPLPVGYTLFLYQSSSDLWLG